MPATQRSAVHAVQREPIRRAVLPFAFNLIPDPSTSLAIERVYAGLATLDIPEQDLVTQYGPCVTILVVEDRVR